MGRNLWDFELRRWHTACWGFFGEGQDDIEKSVQMLDEEGLMLVPYTGYDYSNGYCGYMRSGIQLIDFSEDDLTLRGSTDAVGHARPAVVGDEAVYCAAGYDGVQVAPID